MSESQPNIEDAPYFGDKVIRFLENLNFEGQLPPDIFMMNPFSENPAIVEIVRQFYKKFYSDTKERKIIIGINPGRLGAGSTGIPFTDTKRLESDCGITPPDFKTHEPSSVFIYELIKLFGGPENFYSQFYITSVCPLGFIHKNKKENTVNYNYYDSPELIEAVLPFIRRTLQEQLHFGIHPEVAYVLGKKNAEFLQKINRDLHLFDRIEAFDHPRYIMQYKSKEMDKFLDSFFKKLGDFG